MTELDSVGSDRAWLRPPVELGKIAKQGQDGIALMRVNLVPIPTRTTLGRADDWAATDQASDHLTSLPHRKLLQGNALPATA